MWFDRVNSLDIWFCLLFTALTSLPLNYMFIFLQLVFCRLTRHRVWLFMMTVSLNSWSWRPREPTDSLYIRLKRSKSKSLWKRLASQVKAMKTSQPVFLLMNADMPFMILSFWQKGMFPRAEFSSLLGNVMMKNETNSV